MKRGWGCSSSFTCTWCGCGAIGALKQKCKIYPLTIILSMTSASDSTCYRRSRREIGRFKDAYSIKSVSRNFVGGTISWTASSGITLTPSTLLSSGNIPGGEVQLQEELSATHWPLAELAFGVPVGLTSKSCDIVNKFGSRILILRQQTFFRPFHTKW